MKRSLDQLIGASPPPQRPLPPGRGALGPIFVSCVARALVIWMAIATANDLAADGIEVQECAVRFAAEVDVPALSTGRVAEVSVTVNDTVIQGSPIARLDDRSLLIRRRAAQLRYDSARTDSEDDVEIEYANVALAEAESELDASRSIQRDARGAIPQSRLRQLRLAVERGQLEVAQARKRQKRAAVEARLREADLAVIDDQLQNLQIESPISGLVLEINREAGEWIESGAAIATVGRIDRLHVHALVRSEQLAPEVCRNLPVSVHWSDVGSGEQHTLRGKVLSADPQMLPGGRFRLHAEIVNRPIDTQHAASQLASDQPDQWLLKPGTSVRMKVFPTGVAARNRAGQLR